MANPRIDRNGIPVPQLIADIIGDNPEHEVYEQSRGIPSECLFVFTNQGVFMMHPRVSQVYAVGVSSDALANDFSDLFPQEVETPDPMLTPTETPAFIPTPTQPPVFTAEPPVFTPTPPPPAFTPPPLTPPVTGAGTNVPQNGE